jgi:BirA family biotin operon repressor/biotin-[acetyl-CoA-carboxylase] ligase
MSTLENTTYLPLVSFERARSALHGTRFADLRWTERTGSTNADLVAAAVAGDGECALVADVQDAGRGRLDRRWEAPAGASLLMSVLIRPPFPVPGPQLLSTALGVAAVDAIRSMVDVEVALKWPNDLVAPGVGDGGTDLKLGGMLAELHTGAGGDALVVGIGINVAWPDGFPDELAATATSLDLLGVTVDCEDLAAEVLTRLDGIGELAFSAVACEGLVRAYRDRCATIGRRVRVELPAGELVGEALDVDLSGELVVRDDDGRRHSVSVGDVIHLRPT